VIFISEKAVTRTTNNAYSLKAAKPRVPLWCASRGSTVIWELIFVWGVVVLFWGTCSLVLCPDTLGDTVTCSLVLVFVGGRFMDKISVKAAIASFNLLPVSNNGFAADGFFNASVNSSNAAVALSVEAVVGMVYFSGRNTTVSDTLVPLVLGI
jgi:hypothetical protein